VFAIYLVKFIGRGSAVAGVIMKFEDPEVGTIGDLFLGMYPLIESSALYMQRERESKEKE